VSKRGLRHALRAVMLCKLTAFFLCAIHSTAQAATPQQEMDDLITKINRSISALHPARIGLSSAALNQPATSCNLCHVPTADFNNNTQLTSFGAALQLNLNTVQTLSAPDPLPIPGGTLNGTFTPTIGTFNTLSTPKNQDLPISATAGTGFNDPLNPNTGSVGFTNVPLTAAISSVTPPTNGTAIVNGTQVTFHPNANFVGPATVTIFLYNQVGNSSDVTIHINVGGSNAPIAADQPSIATQFNTALAVNLLTGAGGGAPNTATLVGTPTGGTVSGFPGTTVTFTPTTGFSGNASFQFSLTNGFGTSNIATVTIAVAVPPTPARLAPNQDPSVQALVTEQVQTALRMASSQLSNFSQRLEELRNGAEGFQIAHLGVGVAGQTVSLGSLYRLFDSQQTRAPSLNVATRDVSNLQLVQVAGLADRAPGPVNQLAAMTNRVVDQQRGSGGFPRQASSQAAADDSTKAKVAPSLIDLPPGVGAFFSGQIATGTQSSMFDYYTVSLSGGIDYRINPNLTLGIGGGYSNTSSNLTGGSSGTGEEYSVGLYGVWTPYKHLYVEGVVDMGAVDLSNRRVSPVSSSIIALGNRTGFDFSGSLTAGYDFITGAWLLNPYLRMSAVSVSLDAFQETGAAAANLSYSQETVEALLGTAGFRMGYYWIIDAGTLIPYVRAEYQHNYNGTNQATLVNFVTNPAATPYSIAAPTIHSDVINLGGGIQATLTSGLSLSLEYLGTFGPSDQSAHRFIAGLSQRF
jgi:uncharacterized protein YhjY with autotransporter beta-barrel domain